MSDIENELNEILDLNAANRCCEHGHGKPWHHRRQARASLYALIERESLLARADEQQRIAEQLDKIMARLERALE